ncbi:MAG: PIN domain-containing protein [Actinobacteria bacterium]|nr:PIN domain-containing protein [Actinomycetota bacterium]
MTILDAYAVLALLKDEPSAEAVGRLVRAGGRLTAVGVSEVLDHLVRIAGADEEEALLDLAELGLLGPEAVDADLGARAGILRARHYHRTNRAVSLADCVAAEAARRVDLPVATSDPHLLDLCQEEGIGVLPLPDSSGSTWSPT